MQILLTHELWPEIYRRSKAARKTLAAIAYFSSDKKIRLKKDDVLVVDASQAAIGSGETSAKLLKKLFSKGVQLFSCPDLHAKIIAMDRCAVVGSGNASKSSADTLHEAALLTDLPTTVRQVKALVIQFSKVGKKLEKNDINELLAIKVVRRGRRGHRRKRHPSARGESFWVSSCEEVDDDAYPKEEKYVKQAEQIISGDEPDAEPSWLRLTSASKLRAKAKAGDLIVVSTSKKGKKVPFEVSPPSTILYRQDGKKWTRFYYDSDLEWPLRDIKWKAFKMLLKKAGIQTPIGTNTCRALAASESIRLHEAWPRFKKR